MDNYFRKTSPNERVYIEAQKLFSPLNVQCIFEGNGNIEINEIKEAVIRASNLCPGARLIYLKGKWIDSKKTPEVIEINSDEFNGYNFDVLKLRKMEIDKKPPIEVIILKGKINGIMFRIFHGIMDGKGGLLWIENIFKALRHEPIYIIDSKHSDLTFLKKIGYKKFRNIGFPSKKAFGNSLSEVDYKKVCTKRISIKGNYNSLVAKMAKVFTDYFIDSNSIFMIPVSLRKKDESMLTTANMVLPIFLETTKSETYKDINKKFIEKIRNDEYLNINNAQLGVLRYLPDRVLNKVLSIFNLYCKKLNVNTISGTISYIGNYDVKNFSYTSFTCKTFYSVPLCTPFSPISVAIYKNNNFVEISISYYKSIMIDSMLDKLTDDIIDEIKEIRAYKLLNETSKDINNDSLLELISSSINKFGESIAIKENNKEISYLELDHRSDSMVQVLLEACNPSRKSIVILLDRSIEFIVSVIACIKAGITFIPIDTNDFDIQSENIIAASGSLVVVNNKSSLLIKHNNKIINIENIDLSSKCILEKNFKLNNDIVYRIYTSGTTGIPKGVNISEQSIINYLLWARDTYLIDESNGFAFFTSTSVDLTITSYLLPLIVGGTIYAYRDQLNPIMLRQILNNNAIDYIKITPTHLRLINTLDLNLKDSLDKKVLILGGEQLKYFILKECKGLFGDNCMIINEYGPTETTIGSLYNKIGDLKEGSVPIGKPIYNTIVMLIKDGEQVKQGEIGEIYIGGSGVCSSYTIDEINKSFVYLDGKRYYKTGDLALLNDNNQYVFISRADKQVKINGRRVELQSIEHAILKHKFISDVIVIYDAELNQLVAYYLSEIEIYKEEFISFLSDRLSLYAIPFYYIKIESIPLLKTGKMDEDSLRKLYNTGVLDYNSEVVINESITLLENEIRNIYSKIFKIDISVINIDKSFLELGGDSLEYIELMNEIIIQYINYEDEQKFISIINDSYYELSVRKLSSLINNIVEI